MRLMFLLQYELPGPILDQRYKHMMSSKVYKVTSFFLCVHLS